ncbi:hypothetical protein VOLCADRAFT_104599 [Volvox carteri f. nagariensis]|uniref:Uncharacterized protein n=1 Tax=Volvox carteri f. nagariensis TaxID=3068 RepID=D8TUR9_VOLCA|nr:uncharacterized protein VOLCADRAFT_104599 [Volvox carteri f. nagariensis]EFJ48755.1 hypothetical protein VOLCADRAFT_104599 [Volvox carteri f. nagariensis]|eukprot:XP_002950087.1 hypothetical protein VOLCADRAFT_104599 [Volvox carteri f. nagariensis]
MTRFHVPGGSVAAGSLLFAVEIPGLEDAQCDIPSSSSMSGRHRGSRTRTAEAADIEELAQNWQASAASVRLLNDVRILKRQGQAADAATLAQRLRDVGYDATHVAQNASNSISSSLRLAHDFVIVKGCGGCLASLVVEPDFREHFCIGSMYATERYRQLLDAVPEELVAPYSKIQEMVKLICAEMKFSFEATGNYLPPWRSMCSVLSRWAAARQ